MPVGIWGKIGARDCTKRTLSVLHMHRCAAAKLGYITQTANESRMETRKKPYRLGGEHALFPIANQASNREDLAQVIRVVVGHEKSFAEDGLPRAARDAREKIRPGIRD